MTTVPRHRSTARAVTASDKCGQNTSLVRGEMASGTQVQGGYGGVRHEQGVNRIRQTRHGKRQLHTLFVKPSLGAARRTLICGIFFRNAKIMDESDASSKQNKRRFSVLLRSHLLCVGRYSDRRLPSAELETKVKQRELTSEEGTPYADLGEDGETISDVPYHRLLWK